MIPLLPFPKIVNRTSFSQTSYSSVGSSGVEKPFLEAISVNHMMVRYKEMRA